MKNTQKRIRLGDVAARALAAVLLLCTLGCVLSGCGRRQETGPALVVNTEVISVASEENGNGMSQEALKLLANDIAASRNASNIRTQLVAAYNGYDMTARDFDDDNLPAAQPDKAPEFARNAFKANEIATLSSVDSMTPADVKTLIDCFKTPVSTESETGFLFRLLHWIALGFEWMINTLGFGNFILGTVFFAIVVEIVMLPLAFYQQKNSRRQAMLRPKEMAIRKKYAGRNDQKTMQDMNQEIQQMYMDEGYNPATSGCLPLLVSFPFVIALYYIVIDPLKYIMNCPAEVASALNVFAQAPRAAGGLGLELQARNGSIEILSILRENGTSCLEGLKSFNFFTNSEAVLDTAKNIIADHKIPDFSLFGVNFGLTPSFGNLKNGYWVLLLLPVLTFAVYFFSMKLTRKFNPPPMAAADDKATGCSNTIMDVSMPLMSAGFTFVVPAAVGLYWAIKSVVSTFKSWVMSKVMPLPEFTEADYKAAEKELAGKDKNKPKRVDYSGTPGFRSLHHIDDDEYENENDNRPAAKKGPKQPYREDDETASAAPAAPDDKKETDKKTSSLTEGVKLKDDKPKDDGK